MVRLIGIVSILCVVLSNGQAQEAVEVGKQSQIRELKEAVLVRLRAIEAYELVVKVEQTVEVDETVVPIAEIRWRISYDRTKKLLRFASDVRRLETQLALSGNLDEWTARTVLKTVADREVEEHSIDGRRMRRPLEKFEDAFEREEIPNVAYSGFLETLISITQTREIELKFNRILSLAKRFSFRNTRISQQAGLECCAIIEDERLTESHCWVYELANLEPVAFEIIQSPPGQSYKRSIYSETLKWDDELKYGRVPVEVVCSAPISLVLTGNDESETRVKGKRYTDIKLYWLDAKSRASDFGKDLSIRNIERLFEVE